LSLSAFAGREKINAPMQFVGENFHASVAMNNMKENYVSLEATILRFCVLEV
jgi:hypothetical protein